MNKLVILIILSVLITAIVAGGGIYVLQKSIFEKEKQQLQQQINQLDQRIKQLLGQDDEDDDNVRTNCNDGGDCQKYYGCESMFCANNNPINQQISAKLSSGCDPTIYDPSGAWESCECIDQICQFLEDTTASWQIYRNIAMGIELKIPNNWTVSTHHGEDPATTYSPAFSSDCDFDAGERCFSLGISTGGYDKNKSLKDYHIGLNQLDISEDTILIDNEEALVLEKYDTLYTYSVIDKVTVDEKGQRRTYYKNIMGHPRIYVYTTHNEVVYHMIASERGQDGKTIKTSNDWQYKNIFETILSTIKFFDPLEIDITD